MVFFKSLVRNRAQAEGSIVEGYIANECITFYSRYLQSVKAHFNLPSRNFDHVDDGENFLFSSGGRILGKVESIVLADLALSQAHRYVLLHYDLINCYRRYASLLFK